MQRNGKQGCHDDEPTNDAGNHDDVLLNALRLSECAPSTRSTGSSVTSALANHWPEVAERLTRYLRRRGVDRTEAEDLVQDVAVKVIARDVSFLDSDDLLRWCLPVARNLAVDQFRRAQTATEAAPAVHEAMTRHRPDVVDHVVSRVRLRSTLASIRTMSLPDQRALYASVHGDGTGPVPGAIRVRALRARARLMEMTASAGALVLPFLRFGRRSRIATGLAGPAAAVSLLVAIAVAPGAGTTSDSSSLPQLRVPSMAAHVSPAAASTSPRRTVGEATAPGHISRSAPRRAQQPTSQRVAAVSAPGAPDALLVTSHDRRATDSGVLCVDGLPGESHVCAIDSSRSEPLRITR